MHRIFDAEKEGVHPTTVLLCRGGAERRPHGVIHASMESLKRASLQNDLKQGSGHAFTHDLSILWGTNACAAEGLEGLPDSAKAWASSCGFKGKGGEVCLVPAVTGAGELGAVLLGGAELGTPGGDHWVASALAKLPPGV